MHLPSESAFNATIPKVDGNQSFFPAMFEYFTTSKLPFIAKNDIYLQNIARIL